MSIKQPRNLLVPVNRLARDFCMLITYSKNAPVRHLDLQLWPFLTWACLGKWTKIGQCLSTFVQVLSNLCLTFEARTPLHGPPKGIPDVPNRKSQPQIPNRVRCLSKGGFACQKVDLSRFEKTI